MISQPGETGGRGEGVSVRGCVCVWVCVCVCVGGGGGGGLPPQSPLAILFLSTIWEPGTG